ncbi:MAG TPA: choice-of-anchor Q domain-containing protein, partial [Nocardioides sp.]|nr:choice-of-anchor Q domain-containing protein [Nocardioides sp.]
MRPRLALLLGALVAPALPLLVGAPASAATNICVGSPPGCPAGSTTYATIPDAISHAASGDKIYVGPGSFSDGPYVLPAGVSIQGSGAGTGASATVLTLAAGPQTYLTADGGNVSDLRISMPSGNGATGIAATNGSVVDNVVVLGAGSTSSTGLRTQTATAHDVTVNVTGGSGNTAVSAAGPVNTFTDSTWNGGAVGLRLASGSTTVSRITVRGAGTAIRVEAGSLAIDDTVLDLGAAGTAGLLAQPATGTADVTAGFLTVVGRAAGSRGVVASPTGSGTATVTLTSSIVRGPATSLVRDGGPASLTVTRSDYESASGGVTDGGGNLVGVDPAFIDAATGNYDLRAGSPVIDKGGVASSAAQDRAGRTRSFDGDRDRVAVPDMGAYELHDVTPPTTVITSGPSGPTNDNTPVFTFRSGPDVTFAC